MKLKKAQAIIIIFLVLVIILCLTYFIVGQIPGFRPQYGINERQEMINSVVEEFYGKKYVKKMQKKIQKEDTKISKQVFKDVKEGIPAVNTSIKMIGATRWGTRELVKVIEDEDILRSESKQQWFLDIIEIYNNQNITKSQKEIIERDLKRFYDEESKKMMNQELKEKIEAIIQNVK